MAFRDDLERLMHDEARRLGLGATGRHVEPPIGADDEGELRVGLTVRAGTVVLNFGKSISGCRCRHRQHARWRACSSGKPTRPRRGSDAERP